jgi:hypothetical protein
MLEYAKSLIKRIITKFASDENSEEVEDKEILNKFIEAIDKASTEDELENILKQSQLI